MGLSVKQGQIALDLFGTDRLTQRQFSQMFSEYKQASHDAYKRANNVDLLALAEKYTSMTRSGHTRTGPYFLAAGVTVKVLFSHNKRDANELLKRRSFLMRRFLPVIMTYDIIPKHWRGQNEN